jgi:hypothetical protein
MGNKSSVKRVKVNIIAEGRFLVEGPAGFFF